MNEVKTLKIFLSYAAMEFNTADKVRLALEIGGHQVFFDRTKIPPGGDFNRIIYEEIRYCDLLIFLISPSSLAEGAYARTELAFAQEVWPSPKGHVLSVMAAPMPMTDIPNYLKAISILRPNGDLVAEVAASVTDIASGWKPIYTVLGQAKELESTKKNLLEHKIEIRLAELNQKYYDEHRHKYGEKWVLKNGGCLIILTPIFVPLATILMGNYWVYGSKDAGYACIFVIVLYSLFFLGKLVQDRQDRDYLIERQRILDGDFDRDKR